MKKSKIFTIFSIFVLAILILNLNVLAEEENNNDTEIVTRDLVINYGNYFELNQKIHNEQDSNEEKNESNVFGMRLYSSSSKESIEDYIIRVTMECPEQVDISEYQITEDEIVSIITKVFLDDELFYISSLDSYSLNKSTGYINSLIFSYSMTPSEIEENWNKINEVKEKYLEGIQDEWTDLEKIIYTDNFLCQNCAYGETNLTLSHTLVGALVNGTPVCDGYSKAFIYLLKQVGVESSLVTSDNMNHAWNLVKLDDEYYHVDVTWNDIAGYGKTSYEYFMLSDDEITNKDHSDWVADYTAENVLYEDGAEWDYTDNYLIYKDDYWYYLYNTLDTIELDKYNFREDDWDCKELDLEFDESGLIWSAGFIADGDILVWTAGLTTDGESLYISANDTIFNIDFDFDSDKTEKYFKLSDTTKILYSVEYRDGKMYYDTTDIIYSNNEYETNTSSRKSNIYAPITGIKIVSENNVNEIKVDDTLQLSIEKIPTETQDEIDIVWQSNNSDIAEVDNTGNVTAKESGTVTITATCESKNLTDSFEITILENTEEEPDETEKPDENLVYTTISTQEVSTGLVMVFSKKTTIESIVTKENFPVLDKSYTVVVLDTSNSEKETTEYVGSKNTIQVSNQAGEVVATYTAVVKGDVTGNGLVRMYDAFQILKDVLNPKGTLSDIDILIRDHSSSNDGVVRMYDAFQYLTESIRG
jgi:hypothetical protein